MFSILTYIFAALASVTFNGSTNDFAFDVTPASHGVAVYAIVSNHASLGEFDEQDGWMKLGETAYTDDAGPRVAAYCRQYKAGDASYLLSSGSVVKAKDNRAIGYAVGIDGANCKRSLVGEFSGGDSFADFENFKAPVPVSIPTARAGDVIVWAPFANSYLLNGVEEGFVGEGAGVSFPEFEPAAGQNVMWFNLERNAPVGPGSAHEVFYAGLYIVVNKPLRLRKSK